MKKFMSMILCLAMMLSLGIPTMAIEHTITMESPASSDSTVKLRFVSPEEMNRVISNIESGICTYNWFPDNVLVTATREIKANGSSYCKVVFLNVSFPLDQCDIDGTIWLYDINSIIVGNKVIHEA